jgi:predicted DNA-binding transcriptional regulator AlpA
MIKTSSTPDAAASNKSATNIETLPRYGSKRDVANMVQMSVRSVDNFLRDGCPALRIGKRRVRFEMNEVRAWLADTYRTQRRGAK